MINTYKYIIVLTIYVKYIHECMNVTWKRVCLHSTNGSQSSPLQVAPNVTTEPIGGLAGRVTTQPGRLSIHMARLAMSCHIQPRYRLLVDPIYIYTL